MANLRQEYAARGQTSNIFGEQVEAEQQRPGKRVAPQNASESNIFSSAHVEAAGVSHKAYPAPFLTDTNAVNTHNRRGGFVNQQDSPQRNPHMKDVQVDVDDNPASGEKENAEKVAAEEMLSALNENEDVARSHKVRNNTSNVFGSPVVQEKTTVSNHKMSNNIF